MTPEQLQTEVGKFINDARAKSAGGLTVAEFGQLTVELLELLVVGLETITTLDGPGKKVWALSVVGLLFDSVAGAAVPIYLQPVWLIARPIVRSLVLSAAAGALEQVLSMTRTPAAPAPAVEVKS